MAVSEYFSKLFKWQDPVIVMPYGGYANDEMIHAQARVLEDEGIKHSASDSALRNLWNSFKRFESDEKKGARVKVTWGDQEKIFISDKEGYIYLNEPLQQEFHHKTTLWIPVTFQLMEGSNIIHQITSQVMKPAPEAEFGVISDLDDTVIQTGVSSTLKWKLLVNSLFRHSHNRMPLEGAQEFYKLLHKGKSGFATNPFFYLSNSPWNIHDYLCAFLKKYEFPQGPVLLRDIGISWPKRKSFMEGNKYMKVKHIIETYPSTPFILIGDAAEIDADIYLKIARTFPGQILSIYIRAVKKQSLIRRVESLIEANTDINVVLIREKQEAIEHAKRQGYIDKI
ncbi:DUF2183 domain-containing protein [Fulvivirga sp. 29W222]|uniref:DUF2183 domain-containing protein n=1 Tax=Fulvivirga marina TaxID=2494733 RepID=A0A937KFN7_9BACT|nr:phosphatase domain-containing protein [Fulvivirga marina]MBL6448475.1 DUF2183 domain-containing protein [Fulvivirga marina]